MRKIEHVVKGEEGIHAQVAVFLAQAAKKYSSKILIWEGEKSADSKNLLEIVGLCVKKDSFIQIEITGEDEDIAAEEFTKLIADL